MYSYSYYEYTYKYNVKDEVRIGMRCATDTCTMYARNNDT